MTIICETKKEIAEWLDLDESELADPMPGVPSVMIYRYDGQVENQYWWPSTNLTDRSLIIAHITQVLANMCYTYENSGEWDDDFFILMSPLCHSIWDNLELRLSVTAYDKILNDDNLWEF